MSVRELCDTAASGDLAHVQTLVASGVDVNDMEQFSLTPLMLACMNKHTHVARFLADHPKTNLNLITIHGWTVLVLAADYNRIDIGRHLLTKPSLNVNLRIEQHNNSTALHGCIRQKHPEFAKLLLDHPKVDVSILDGWGKTALHVAVETDEIALVKTLLPKLEVLINVQDNQGNTVLHHCSISNQTEMAQLLLDQPKIGLLIKNNEGKTAVDLAVEEKHTTINQLILRKMILYSIEAGVATGKRKRESM